ncbi:MAG: hypothetical protein JWL70_2306 [Acidimicrobiia bacterium]|nr:hypothetical protein [Acidimicrobiia bacterium]
MASDEQGIAEGLDGDVIDDRDDYAGDLAPEYPPEVPLALDFLEVSDPDTRARSSVGSTREGIDIIEGDDDLGGEAVTISGLDLSAEEAAMHVIEE